MHQLSIAKWVPLNEWDTIVPDRDKMLVALKKWRPFFCLASRRNEAFKAVSAPLKNRDTFLERSFSRPKSDQIWSKISSGACGARRSGPPVQNSRGEGGGGLGPPPPTHPPLGGSPVGKACPRN